jgi:glycosyltransferase involved in cell wall biosynthesis
MSRVDVVIPVFGKPKYFAETVESVVNQPLVENVIVVLDRVDKEYLVKLKFESDKIKYYTSNTPGIVSALNLGLEKSKADFVARIDSDDIMFPERIQVQFHFLISNPGYVCVGSSLEIFGDGMKNKLKRYPSEHKKIVKHLSYQNAMAHPSVMYRKATVVNVGGYRRIFEGAEDYDLWLRLSKIGKLYNFREPLTRYRVTSEQYSSKFSCYRSELDSLVRLLNLDSEQNIPISFFDSPATSHQIKESLKIYSRNLQLKQRGDYEQLLHAQNFGRILAIKSSKNTKLIRYSKMITLLTKLIISSPQFAMKVINGKIFK